jgi:hypothetical protein
MGAVRWNIAVSEDTDRSVRMHLAAEGGGRKGDLSRFIEEAVRTQIFERTVAKIKAANAEYSDAEMDSAIDEAIEWARQTKP